MNLNIIKITKLNAGGFQTKTMEVSAPSMTDAIMFLATETEKDKDCYFMDGDTLSPITFDYSAHYKRVDEEGTIASDMFNFTFNEMLAQRKKNTEHERFVNNTKPYIRVHKSKSGRAGDYFKLFTNLIERKQELPDGTIFNNSQFYFENRNVPEVL